MSRPVARRGPSIIFVPPWVGLSGVSATAQALYIHLLQASDYEVGLEQVVELLSLDSKTAEPYFAELISIGALTWESDGLRGHYLTHEIPPENYIGPTAYYDLWAARPRELDKLMDEFPSRPRSPLDRARAAFDKSPERKLLRAQIANGMHVCANCTRPDELTVDHIVALAVGGTNDMDNLQILCRSCNSRKGIRAA